MKHATRPDLLIGATLITVSLGLHVVTHLPLWVFVAFLLTGVYLWGEAARTHHVFQSALCFERTIAAQAKAPKPQTITVSTKVAPNIRDLIYDWADNKPTTKEYAITTHHVTQQQWQAVVEWAVGYGLGYLVPSQGGSNKLRWTSKSLNEYLPLMDGLAGLA